MELDDDPPVLDALESELHCPPSDDICPDCNGSLMSVSDTSYRCRGGLHEKARMSRKPATNVGHRTLLERSTTAYSDSDAADAG
jgi:hypothetical protein